MCMEHKILCKCGKQDVSFQFKDEIMPAEVVRRLYCPECSARVKFDPKNMVNDNGWLIKYDMDVADLYGQKLPVHDRSNLSPEILFDSGYATWRGIYPGDHSDSAYEKTQLLELSKTNPREYIEAMKDWGNNRMKRLRKEGWRKANEKESV